MPTVAELAKQELDRRYSLQGRTQVAPRVQTMQNARPTVRSALSNLMRDAIDATGLEGGYRQGLLNAAGGVETAVDFLPVVGDAIAVDDAAQAYGQGDMVGAGINMMGVVPVIGDAGVKLSKGARSALRDQGFTEGFFHASKQDIQDGFKAGYSDGMVFVTPEREFANNWVGKGKYQQRLGEESIDDMRRADRQKLWDEYESQYGSYENWPAEIEDEYNARSMNLSRQYQASGGAMYPVAVKANKQFDPEENPEIIAEFLKSQGRDPNATTIVSGKTDLEAYQEGNYLFYENKEMADFLRDKGFDSVWLREDTTPQGLSKPFSTLAVLDETGVKPVYDFAREADAAASALRGLDMNPEARMQRAQDQGYEPIYHGSTYDIEQIDLSGMSPESHFGRGFYSTTSPRDASENYARTFGPDLKNKINRRAEQIEDELELTDEMAVNAGYADVAEMSFDMAKKEVQGPNEGVVYPLMGRTTNAFDISNDGNTFLRYEQPEINPEDYLDEAGGDMDVAYDLAQEAAYDFEPEGELVDFLESLRRNPYLSQDDFETLQSSILEEAYDGGISANRLDEIFRSANIYPEDDAGNLISHDIFRQAIQDSGYDTIIHNADIFRGMDVDKGTKHKIFLDPTRVRSINAEFDPEKMDSADLLSSVGATSALRGIA